MPATPASFGAVRANSLSTVTLTSRPGGWNFPPIMGSNRGHDRHVSAPSCSFIFVTRSTVERPNSPYQASLRISPICSGVVTVRGLARIAKS